MKIVFKNLKIKNKATIQGLTKTLHVLYRVLIVIDSDQGTHFTSHHIAELWNKVVSEFSSPLVNGCRPHKLPLWL